MPDARFTVACLGLGAMGSAMAHRLVLAGHGVWGTDVKPGVAKLWARGGGEAADTAEQAARQANLVLVMVHDAAQVEEALWGPEGAMASLRAGTIVWLASTVDPDYVRDLVPRLNGRGVALLDGPVSGGATGARAGSLTVIAGAAPDTLARAQPALAACASTVHHVGAPGAGSTVKSIHQLLVASQVALTAEAMALAAACDVDMAQFIRVVQTGSAQSRMFDKRAPRMLQGDHQPQATVQILLKDLDLTLVTASRRHSPAPMAHAARAVFAQALADGLGAESDTRLLDWYQTTSAWELASSPTP